MSDLIKRAQKARAFAADLSLPQWQRLSEALQALSGLELSDLADDVRESLEADFAGVNRVLAEYSLTTYEDYRTMSDADVQEALDIVDAAASHAIAAELDRIVEELGAGVGKLPVDAIGETREHRDLMVPRLIRVLREAASEARANETPEGNAHFFAVFLLTEFQAAEAFPVILEVFSLPGELPHDLFGDAVTEMLARILARFAGDRPELLDAMIADSSLNEYVRWEAAQTYLYLVRDGRLRREEVVQHLQRNLRQAIDREDMEMITELIGELADFAPKEAIQEITEAYQRGLVYTGMIDFGTVEEGIAEGDDCLRRQLERCPPTGIKDTIEELRHWAAFSEKPARQRPPLPPPAPLPRSPLAAELGEPIRKPVVSHGSRFGRNDPCPCGSGKKYKKCCGARK
ncbi:MAG: DUF1186 domain-containing protein [Pirellulales bacterium]|nr:DUF1186 domain-containing protein [Pirellulales bacterium]